MPTFSTFLSKIEIAKIIINYAIILFSRSSNFIMIFFKILCLFIFHYFWIFYFCLLWVFVFCGTSVTDGFLSIFVFYNIQVCNHPVFIESKFFWRWVLTCLFFTDPWFPVTTFHKPCLCLPKPMKVNGQCYALAFGDVKGGYWTYGRNRN